MAFLLPSQPVASTSRIVLAAAQSHLPRHLPPLARSSSTATASSSSTSAGTSASSPPRRASSRRLSARPGANLVGPADPLSNLRPVVYGSAFQTILDSHDQTGNSSIDTSSSGASSSSSAALSHPYSTSEFNSLPSASSASSSWSRSLPPRSEYQTSLLRRLEAAELAHHLRRARADRFSQDFWEDNNRRYTKALEEYRRSRSGVGERSSSSSSSISATSSGSASRSLQDGTQSGSASHPSSSSSSFSSQTQTQTPTKPPKASEDLLSPFYSAWLSANAARHQAYNERLWRITREDLVPAAQYSLLRTWCAVVAWGEAKLGSVIGAGASSRSSRDKEGW
ncbi:hypothetical protein BCV69DRAFT_182297 [Microstroma glucosiphilum]|uniref:Uncharacterized protein n=1 Tax=Pseudomicrostroma glucosiphilum TaxID=1684307 RepID=A0A316U9G4_9BASI|nr:hypothetical protein BCV69DRAFT_182297 [Pseudomicrostroma glucosiphilum]PWN21033.1 hypothetical protein BCV69DRAFT_182297 [Pseudomicrostroma glucosiphilum]